jgi:hypothetical protein
VAFQYGAIKILSFLTTPKTIRYIETFDHIHVNLFRWVSAGCASKVFEEWRQDASFMTTAVEMGNLEALRYLHSQGFPASYIILYDEGLSEGNADVLELVEENFPVNPDFWPYALLDNKVAKVLLKLFPDRYQFCVNVETHAPEVYWYSLKI